jgi:small subunit ribosomal protein S8
MNYRIGDFVIRIKNASLAKRRKVVMPYSRAVLEVGKVLVKKGFLESIKEVVVKDRKVLEAVVKFDRREPRISDVQIVSKPSLRVYSLAKDIPKIEKGMVTVVMSTSNGIMVGKDAYKKGIGGEVLFKIW